MSSKGWIGVDLDGTLAQYEGWRGELHIGAPVPKMVERVRKWFMDGVDVRIFTARVWDDHGQRDIEPVTHAIQCWCLRHLGFSLPVTNVKDFHMVELWDDRAVQIKPNTGERVDGQEDQKVGRTLTYREVEFILGANAANELFGVGFTDGIDLGNPGDLHAISFVVRDRIEAEAA